MSEPFLGQIQTFGFGFAPRGWAQCNGQILPIAQNTALFSLLGTTYGGNGQTTFALPDLRSRWPNHQGQGPGLSSYDLGQVGGVENETLTIQNMPAHNHPATVGANSEGSTSADPTNNFLGNTAVGNIYAGAGGANMNANMVTIGISGGSQPFPVIQPYLTINFCIALEGIFPSRN
jgi:microcystin-dependent protein